jgi:hypothetical protein
MTISPNLISWLTRVRKNIFEKYVIAKTYWNDHCDEQDQSVEALKKLNTAGKDLLRHWEDLVLLDKELLATRRKVCRK